MAKEKKKKAKLEALTRAFPELPKPLTPLPLQGCIDQIGYRDQKSHQLVGLCCLSLLTYTPITVPLPQLSSAIAPTLPTFLLCQRIPGNIKAHLLNMKFGFLKHLLVFFETDKNGDREA